MLPTGGLLAAGLLLFGLLFRQLVTLMLAVLVTVIIAVPLADAATKSQRRGVPRPAGALITLLGALALLGGDRGPPDSCEPKTLLVVAQCRSAGVSPAFQQAQH
jgi:hypothetical protein